MNCEKCQDLISDFLDGSLSQRRSVNAQCASGECLECADVRNDLQSIVGFCRTHRGEYAAPPNEKALWLRIRNMIEAGASRRCSSARAASGETYWSNWVSRSWELSFPQLAAAAAAIVLVVSLSTVVGLRRFQSGNGPARCQLDQTSLSLAEARCARPRFAAAAVDFLLEPASGIQQGALESADARDLRSKPGR